MRKIIGITLVLFSHMAVAAELPQVTHQGDFVLGETLSVQSTILSESRQLNVYLPPSYASEPNRNYPVIYLLDGSKDEDFIHITGLVQFASFSWINMLPESIVVGIANVDRKRDFTYPSQFKLDNDEFPTSGGSASFIGFIEKELQPLVNSTYRTSAQTTLIGQSLGGLLATQILFEKPSLFERYIIVSPSLWWDEERLLHRDTTLSLQNKKVVVAGGKEGPVMERTAKALYDKLQAQKGSDSQVFYDFLEDKDHGDALHLAVYHAFEMFASQEEKSK